MTLTDVSTTNSADEVVAGARTDPPARTPAAADATAPATGFSLALNDDQLQIQGWVHGFAEDVIRPAAHEWDEREETPWPIIEEAASIGLYSLDFVAIYADGPLVIGRVASPCGGEAIDVSQARLEVDRSSRRVVIEGYAAERAVLGSVGNANMPDVCRLRFNENVLPIEDARGSHEQGCRARQSMCADEQLIARPCGDILPLLRPVINRLPAAGATLFEPEYHTRLLSKPAAPLGRPFDLFEFVEVQLHDPFDGVEPTDDQLLRRLVPDHVPG